MIITEILEIETSFNNNNALNIEFKHIYLFKIYFASPIK